MINCRIRAGVLKLACALELRFCIVQLKIRDWIMKYKEAFGCFRIKMDQLYLGKSYIKSAYTKMFWRERVNVGDNETH